MLKKWLFQLSSSSTPEGSTPSSLPGKNYSFRDLIHQKPEPIVLRQNDPNSGKSQSVGAGYFGAPSLPENIIDLSRTQENLVVLTASDSNIFPAPSKKQFFDIVPYADSERRMSEIISKPSEIFIQIDERHYRRRNAGAELARVAAVGILILGLFHGINVYQRGLVLKDTLIASASEGYQNILSAGQKAQNANFPSAGIDFQQASSRFRDALQLISFLNANHDLFYSNQKTVQSVQGLLNAGKNLADAGTQFIDVLEKLQNLPALMLEPIKNVASLDPQKDQPQKAQPEKQKSDVSSQTPSLTTQLKNDLQVLQQADDKLEIAADDLALVDGHILPKTLRQKFTSGQEKLQQLLSILNSARQQIPVLLKLLGDRYPHRYLVLLQNDTEARPTGGFIGSYLIVDCNDGQIDDFEFHDVYDADGQLHEQIPAPEDIAKMTHDWRLRDANYSPDFAISAEKAAWFLQKEKGPSVDSVIAINQHFLADLFDVTGPITLDGLSAPLTKDNYQTIISYIVESKLSGDQDPKKILRSFIPAFQKKLFTSANVKKTFQILLQGIEQKNLLFYSRDEEIQHFFESMGLAGKVLSVGQKDDYLDVVSTSIGGNKSDLYLKQSLVHNTTIDLDGTVGDELTITREHQWKKESAIKLKTVLKTFGFTQLSSGIEAILGGGENKSIVKVYVPLGSTLLGATMNPNTPHTQNISLQNIAVRQDQDLQKTYFMFEMDVAPGKVQSIALRYQLPSKLDFGIADSYQLFVQKQPGLVLSNFQKNIAIASGLNFYAEYPKNISAPDTTSKKSALTTETIAPTVSTTPPSSPVLFKTRPSWLQQGQLAHYERLLDRDFHVAMLIGK